MQRILSKYGAIAAVAIAVLALGRVGVAGEPGASSASSAPAWSPQLYGFCMELFPVGGCFNGGYVPKTAPGIAVYRYQDGHSNDDNKTE